MRNRIIIIFILAIYSCSSIKDQKIDKYHIQNNNIIRFLIKEKKIEGQLIFNDFDKEVNVDSLVSISVKYPFEQNYTIDSIYYFFYTESNYKILAQSEYEKGLLYLEVDKKGNHTRVTNFGGYVTAVKNVVSKNNINDIELTFTVDAWPSTMPDTLSQHVKIKSSTDNIDFQVYYKGDKGKWIETERD